MEHFVAALVAVLVVGGIYFLVNKADKSNPKKAYTGERVVKDANVKKEVE